MRISDWSSDVCSSDLEHEVGPGPAREDVLAEVRAVDRAPDPSRRRLELVVAEGREVAEERRLVVERGAAQREEALDVPERSEERRVGKEGVSTGRSRGSPYL